MPLQKMETLFAAERDSACRATIITAISDRPVAYEGHGGREIMQLMITDQVRNYLIQVWKEVKIKDDKNVRDV